MKHAFIAAFLVIVSCKEHDENIQPAQVVGSDEIIGEWIFKYKILDNGTRDFDNPYALLEFTYSDGFILNHDSTGNSLWYGVVNDSFDKWMFTNSVLKIQLFRSDGSIGEFEYIISNFDGKSMVFTTPGSHKYFMTRN